jgi:hypothetical protein
MHDITAIAPTLHPQVHRRGLWKAENKAPIRPKSSVWSRCGAPLRNAFSDGACGAPARRRDFNYLRARKGQTSIMTAIAPTLQPESPNPRWSWVLQEAHVALGELGRRYTLKRPLSESLSWKRARLRAGLFDRAVLDEAEPVAIRTAMAAWLRELEAACKESAS